MQIRVSFDFSGEIWLKMRTPICIILQILLIWGSEEHEKFSAEFAENGG